MLHALPRPFVKFLASLFFLNPRTFRTLTQRLPSSPSPLRSLHYIDSIDNGNTIFRVMLLAVFRLRRVIPPAQMA